MTDKEYGSIEELKKDVRKKMYIAQEVTKYGEE